MPLDGLVAARGRRRDVGFGALYCVLRVTRPPTHPTDVAAFDPTSFSLSGVYLAQLAVGVLGVLLVTGEYATGTIRATLAAVPRRLPVLWGKAVVHADSPSCPARRSGTWRPAAPSRAGSLRPCRSA